MSVDRQRSLVTGPVVVSLLVVILLINVIALIVVDFRILVPRCTASVVLEEIEVVRDTDPNFVYPNSTDSWNGNVTFILNGVPHPVNVGFEGDTGHIEVLNMRLIDGADVGQKGDTIDYFFTARLFERDGPPYGGPLPWDPSIPPHATGSLQCPRTYPLHLPVGFAALNNGEVETEGWLVFSFTVELDP